MHNPPNSCIGFVLTKSAGFLQVVFVCAGVLMQHSDAGTALGKHAAAGSCRLNNMSVLIKYLLRESLNAFVSTKWNSSSKMPKKNPTLFFLILFCSKCADICDWWVCACKCGAKTTSLWWLGFKTLEWLNPPNKKALRFLNVCNRLCHWC